MNLWIKPSILVGAVKDDRHTIVDLTHQLIGGCRQDRKGVPFVRSTGMPRVPDARDAHDGFVAEMNLERPLSLPVVLPLKKTAQRDDGALSDDEITTQSALEDRFA